MRRRPALRAALRATRSTFVAGQPIFERVDVIAGFTAQQARAFAEQFGEACRNKGRATSAVSVDSLSTSAAAAHGPSPAAAAVVNPRQPCRTMPPSTSPPLPPDLRSGHRAAWRGRSTRIESRRGDHQAAARDLVHGLLPRHRPRQPRRHQPARPRPASPPPSMWLGHDSDRGGPQGRGARGDRPLLRQPRLDPLRQDRLHARRFGMSAISCPSPASQRSAGWRQNREAMRLCEARVLTWCWWQPRSASFLNRRCATDRFFPGC